MKKDKIWVLFSIANNYDQPDANIIAWWTKKPTVKAVADILSYHPKLFRGLLLGKTIRVWNVDYRLECVKEGKYGRD